MGNHREPPPPPPPRGFGDRGSRGRRFPPCDPVRRGDRSAPVHVADPCADGGRSPPGPAADRAAAVSGRAAVDRAGRSPCGRLPNEDGRRSPDPPGLSSRGGRPSNGRFSRGGPPSRGGLLSCGGRPSHGRLSRGPLPVAAAVGGLPSAAACCRVAAVLEPVRCRVAVRVAWRPLSPVRLSQRPRLLSTAAVGLGLRSSGRASVGLSPAAAVRAIAPQLRGEAPPLLVARDLEAIARILVLPAGPPVAPRRSRAARCLPSGNRVVAFLLLRCPTAVRARTTSARRRDAAPAAGLKRRHSSSRVCARNAVGFPSRMIVQ